MSEFSEKLPQVNSPERSQDRSNRSRFEQKNFQPLEIENILQSLNYEGLLNARAQVIDKIANQPDGQNTELQNTFLDKINTKIQRIEDLKKIKSTSFDPENLAKFEKFVENGQPMIAKDINQEDYLVIHGNIITDPETGEKIHMVEDGGKPKDTFVYIVEQIELGKISRNSILNLASCHIGEIKPEVFNSFVNHIKAEYGIDIRRVSDQDGKIQVAVTPQQRLDNLRNTSSVKDYQGANAVSFQAV
jgi:hypothetical protein